MVIGAAQPSATTIATHAAAISGRNRGATRRSSQSTPNATSTDSAAMTMMAKRAGTRMPSMPGTIASSQAYGPCVVTTVPQIRT